MPIKLEVSMNRIRKTLFFSLRFACFLNLIGIGAVCAQDEMRPVPLPLEPWQKDVHHFESELRKLMARARIPEQKALEKRIEEKSGDLEVITDGYGGVVDFNAAEGTVQYVANEMVQGRPIEWEFELAGDAKLIYNGSIHLDPKFSTKPKGEIKEKNTPLLATIKIKESSAGPFKAGDRVRLKAYVDDFSRFRKGFSRATGLIAVYYLEDAPPAMFWLHFDRVELSLVKQTK